MTQDDEKYMKEALREAEAAAMEDEVPVGAVVVCRGRVIARGHNMTERLNDPTAHAEMIAITAATEAMGGKYLNDCTLYVTVEPCPMCAGALAWSQIGRVVYGASDPKKDSAFSPLPCSTQGQKSQPEYSRMHADRQYHHSSGTNVHRQRQSKNPYRICSDSRILAS